MLGDTNDLFSRVFGLAFNLDDLTLFLIEVSATKGFFPQNVHLNADWIGLARFDLLYFYLAIVDARNVQLYGHQTGLEHFIKGTAMWQEVLEHDQIVFVVHDTTR